MPRRPSPRGHSADWTPFCVEAAMGSLSALAAVPDGQLVRDPALRRLLRAAAGEAAAAARSAGLRVGGSPAAVAEKRCRKSPDRRHPWQSALRARRRTGADAVLGPLLAAARRSGTPAPVLSLAAKVLRRLEKKA